MAFLRTPNPRGGDDAISIMHTADTSGPTSTLPASCFAAVKVTLIVGLGAVLLLVATL
jgi:hypothetical protein